MEVSALRTGTGITNCTNHFTSFHLHTRLKVFANLIQVHIARLELPVCMPDRYSEACVGIRVICYLRNHPVRYRYNRRTSYPRKVDTAVSRTALVRPIAFTHRAEDLALGEPTDLSADRTNPISIGKLAQRQR